MYNATVMAPEATIARASAWAWVAATVALFAIYVLLQENGALLSSDTANLLHELTHDGRHALGVACH